MPCDLATMLLYPCVLSSMCNGLSTQWRVPNQYNSAGWERVADHLASAAHHKVQDMLGIPSAETCLLRKWTPASHNVALSGGLALVG